MILVLALTVGALFTIGTYMLLSRTLTRIIIGLGILSHAGNLLLLIAGGRAGLVPVIGTGDPSKFTDPLPQAMALTAIVISFGVTAFLLALAYRSWTLTHDDEVEDDVEDRRIARLGQQWHDLRTHHHTPGSAPATKPGDAPEGDRS
jgi:multicomponent Na+:H+ antiporter subunit C